MNVWKIVLWDGEEITVPPQSVDAVKAKMKTGEGHIISAHRTIAVKDIRQFVETSQQAPNPVPQIAPLTEEVIAQVFNEPIITESGGIAARAVKKSVTRREFENFYSKSPGYILLSSNDHGVDIGFVLPVHLINHELHTDCNPEETQKVLTRK